MSREGTSRQSVVLALKDPRAQEGIWNRTQKVWNDLHNPYSMRYDQLIAEGHAVLASSCLPAMTLEMQIDEVGACGARARVRIIGEVHGATPRMKCVSEVIQVLLQDLAKDFDFEVQDSN